MSTDVDMSNKYLIKHTICQLIIQVWWNQFLNLKLFMVWCIDIIKCYKFHNRL
jgi:hypothetical protein